MTGSILLFPRWLQMSSSPATVHYAFPPSHPPSLSVSVPQSLVSHLTLVRESFDERHVQETSGAFEREPVVIVALLFVGMFYIFAKLQMTLTEVQKNFVPEGKFLWMGREQFVKKLYK